MLLIFLNLLLFILFMIVIHEIGHILAIYSIKGKLIKLKISFSSIQGIFEYPSNLTFRKYLFFTINGVLFQLIVSIILMNQEYNLILKFISMFYLCVIAINVVPFSLTDGAYVFKAYPSKIIFWILWLIVVFLFFISLYGLILLWNYSSFDLILKYIFTSISFLMFFMSLRRIYYLYKEEQYERRELSNRTTRQ